jgi:hypothetical protein
MKDGHQCRASLYETAQTISLPPIEQRKQARVQRLGVLAIGRCGLAICPTWLRCNAKSAVPDGGLMFLVHRQTGRHTPTGSAALPLQA